MKPQRFLLLSSIFLAILFFFNTSPVTSCSQEDEREFSYVRGSKRGPEHWGELKNSWSACGTGKLQSPIDLSDERVRVLPQLGELRSSYHPANAVMKNRGHDIEIEWKNQTGGIWINGTKYVLQQLHWHLPSEHTINGRRYSLELHMVHQTADNKTAVVGILYKIGRPDPFLAKMEDYLKKVEDLAELEEEKLGMVDPRDVRKGSSEYYRYMGSLTAPPCTEGVVWIIIRKVRTVTQQQVNLLREAVHDDVGMNARPLQPINNRSVGLYRP
ncbi:alpha carbonic anhydrase 7 isoform X2 [Elaeis guineensis]|uniref:Carbonic anhydrase n=1 Tax=Elaeis guineensis var. tenera TaxID=51953 RepID=A0A6I9QWQ6_ELAGV|nr:alpha carbonic anhydrase 7 isoform X2 [Elaeis guineensis]